MTLTGTAMLITLLRGALVGRDAVRQRALTGPAEEIRGRRRRRAAAEAAIRHDDAVVGEAPTYGSDRLMGPRCPAMFDAVAACVAVYEQARLSLDESDVRTHELLLRARVSLGDCLAEAGWTPSREVAAQLRRDRELLTEPVGALEYRCSSLRISVTSGLPGAGGGPAAPGAGWRLAVRRPVGTAGSRSPS